MLSFRFWGSDSKGSDKTLAEGTHPSMLTHDITKTAYPDPRHRTSASERATAVRAPKRRRLSATEQPESQQPLAADDAPLLKRTKVERDDVVAQGNRALLDHHARPGFDDVTDVIQYQFGLEILLKHDELRLIDQELAKCQIALEQLRRCHLIPYPTACPTPQQMLEVSSGTGPALQMRHGQAVPQWAPPFGVVDGPYARHYAKWLIPDPVFDGMQADWHPYPEIARAKAGLDARATRNAVSDGTGFGKRPVRGAAGQKLHALSSGYPQPKDKNFPCILKRSDGQTVKLVCNDCHRENFSSTQGFINHCRIAHRKEFKSHEEAAVHCGHPIDVDEGGSSGAGADDRASATPGSGLVHPLARNEPMSDRHAYAALLSRIDASLKLFYQGKLSRVSAIPGAEGKNSSETPNFTSASETPYLSRLLQKRKFDGDLSDLVADAKATDDSDDDMSDDDASLESDRPTPTASHPDGSFALPAAAAARTPVVMRVPARTSVVPLPIIPTSRPTSRKSQFVPGLAGTHAISTDLATAGKKEADSVLLDEDDLDAELSPNTLAGNNAPSLVSDDGEYDDDSDGGSTAGTSVDDMDSSLPDVAEIALEDDHDAPDHEGSRGIRHHRRAAGTAVQLRKDEAKHVTFMSPVRTGRGRGRRKQKV